MAQNVLNVHLNDLEQFFGNSKLLLNANKTELLHILGFVKDTNPSLRRRTRAIKISVGGKIIKPSKDIRLLGIQFQQNNRFARHIDIRLKKANRAKHHIGRILRNKHISTRVKCGVYKQYIRPIVTFGAPIWCRQPSTTSHQVERIRRFERTCLRQASGLRRDRGSYRHVSAKRIYNATKCPRIDKFMANRHIRFFGNLSTLGNVKSDRITAPGRHGAYTSIDHLRNLHDADALLTDGELLVFNQKYDGSGTVYNTSQ